MHRPNPFVVSEDKDGSSSCRDYRLVFGSWCPSSIAHAAADLWRHLALHTANGQDIRDMILITKALVCSVIVQIILLRERH